MSELKAVHAFDVYEAYTKTGDDDAAQVYLKSEADKVIADKDAKILALDAEVFKQKHHAKLFFDERNYAETQLRHHKYKRCLDKAEMCKARYDEEDAKVNGSGASWEYISKEMKYWERWRNRWLELAEQFKEEK